jgi:hypothetical protein
MRGISTGVCSSPFLSEQREQYEQSEQREQREQREQYEQYEQREQYEQYEQSEQSEQREQREQYEQYEQYEQSEQSEQREQYEQYEQSEQSEQYEQSEQLTQLSQPFRLSSAFCAASREPKYSTEHLLPLVSCSQVVLIESLLQSLEKLRARGPARVGACSWAHLRWWLLRNKSVLMQNLPLFQ